MTLWNLNVILIAIGLLGAMADVWILRWAKTLDAGWGLASVLASLGSLGCFALILRSDTRSFSAIFMLSSVVHILVAIAADIVFWGTRLNRTEWLGITLAVLACLLLEQRHESPAASAGTSAQLPDRNQ